MSGDLATVGRMIRDARDKRDLTQGEVAESLNERTGDNYLHTTIGRIEKGTRKITLIEAVNLCDILGIEWEEIFKVLRPRNTDQQLFQIQMDLEDSAGLITQEVNPRLKSAMARIVELIDSLSGFNRGWNTGLTRESVRSEYETLSELINDLSDISEKVLNSAVEFQYQASKSSEDLDLGISDED